MDFKQILTQYGFRFNKQFGQNFLTDKQLLSEIVSDAGVNGGTVLEIGAGAGTLTRALAQKADRVIAYEIDRNLEQVLAVTLADCPNVQVVIGDVTKRKIADLDETCGNNYRVVANIPYYLTTPLITSFVEDSQNVTSLTLTIQKEVADRLNAVPSTKDYGALTVGVQAVADVTLTRTLSRKLFYPEPNVDSAVVRIDMNRNKFDIPNRKLFRKTVRIAFAMRRKTLVNNLMTGFNLDRTSAEAVVSKCSLPVGCRGEELSVQQFVALYKTIESNTTTD